MDDGDLLDIEGQVAIVTGAGRGAGRAMALELARHNAGGIAVNDFNPERAETVAEEVRALGVKAVAVPFDVTDEKALKEANEKISAEIAPATILVNNAGNAGPTADANFGAFFWDEAIAEWDKYIQTNMFGVMKCAHTFLPNMVEAKRGRVVTIVSDAGRVGEARLAAYSAAKAGAAGFMRAIAKETGRFGITCNCIALSTLEPPLPPDELEAYLTSDRAKKYVSNYVVRRYGKPEDVAAMVAFLCSKSASWITGQTYPVNGGYTFAI